MFYTNALLSFLGITLDNLGRLAIIIGKEASEFADAMCDFSFKYICDLPSNDPSLENLAGEKAKQLRRLCKRRKNRMEREEMEDSQ